jgi:N-acetylmuramoyl-L-alanine amidase
MPIQKFSYDGKSIRTTLGFSDYQHAKKIQEYNEQVVRAGQKSARYIADRELWVPLHLLPQRMQAEQPARKNGSWPIFGPDYSEVALRDQRLSGKFFYLISGHGGPDPGAIGKRGSAFLCEDEYAYDITLRLAKRLLEHGARVYVIVQDPNDGIRDDALLKSDRDEYYYGKKAISLITRYASEIGQHLSILCIDRTAENALRRPPSFYMWIRAAMPSASTSFIITKKPAKRAKIWHESFTRP